MRYNYYIYFLLFFVIITGCRNKQQQSLEEKRSELQAGLLQSDGSYTVDEIGWTVQIPRGWEVIKKEEMKRMQAKGKKEMEKTFDTEIDDSAVEQLISIKKDRINSFISNMQKAETGEDIPDFDERSKIMFDLIKETYRSKGMKFEAAVGATRIGGIMFNRLELRIFVKNSKKPTFYQDMYTAPINGYDFSMFTTYDNDNDMQTLWNVLHSSTFSKKEEAPAK